MTRILQLDPAARLDAKHELWYTNSYHWGEPEMGYFLSQDEYVIRKDMSMLADAGIDVLVMDVTNAVRYWDEWEVTFTTMQKMKAEGNKVPQFIFWAFNGPVITVVQDLYDRIYKEGKYRDLWFYWDGKPLLLFNGNPTVDANGKGVNNPNPHYEAAAQTDPTHPHYGDPDYAEPNYLDYTREVKEFFTLRTMWWGYYEWAGKRFVGTEDNWSFGYSMADPKVKALKPEELLSTPTGKGTGCRHTVAVTIIKRTWAWKIVVSSVRRTQTEQYDLPEPTYVRGWENRENRGYGIYFQNGGMSLAADLIPHINDWNEWVLNTVMKENHAGWVDRVPSFRRPVQPEFNRLSTRWRLYRQLLHADGPEYQKIQGREACTRTKGIYFYPH